VDIGATPACIGIVVRRANWTYMPAKNVATCDSDVLTMKSVVFLNNSHFLEMCPLHKVKFLMKQRISQIPYELSFKVQQREGPRGNFYWFKLSKKHNRQLLQGPTLRV
jgi:hypothetical protein